MPFHQRGFKNVCFVKHNTRSWDLGLVLMGRQCFSSRTLFLCQFGQKVHCSMFVKSSQDSRRINWTTTDLKWIWCRRGSPEQKKCFALSLSSICVSSLDVWRLWITWFYRLINGGDFRQRLLEHETQSRARKSPDVDIDQSVRYSQHIDRSAWSGIFTWRFWPNLLRGHYVCSIGWFSNIVAMDKFTS